MSDWIWLKGILMSHSIEQVLNKVTVWCEQSSLSELVTFDLSYKRISKCKTWVKTGCIQVLLQKLISNSDALAHFWGQVGNCVWRQHRQLKFHPSPPISALHPPFINCGMIDGGGGWHNSANMSQPSSSVWADRPRQEFELQPTLFVDLPPFVWSSSWVSKRVTQYWPKKIKQNWNGLDYDRCQWKSLPIKIPFLY